MRKSKLFYIFIAAIILVLIFALWLSDFRICGRLGKPLLIPAQSEFQKGMTYVAWTEQGYSNTNSVKSMERLVSLGVEWVCLVSTWYQDKCGSTEIFPLNEKSPSDQSLLFAIRELHNLNLKVMLKPHLDLLESDGKWRGDIGGSDSAYWRTWFANYTDFILHYARLAEQEKVELFCIGTELSNCAVSQPALWRDLIKKVRRVYKGSLTYSANWYEEYDCIEFWDALDYAGINPYFPLVSSLNPTAEDLKEVWEDWLGMIEEWQKDIDKPVILTEIGYKSSKGAIDEPWQHSPIGKVDLQLQADCYEALLATFWEKPWFYGVYWWYWGVNPKMGGEFHRGFTPQNKLAEEVLRKWYKKSVPPKAY